MALEIIDEIQKQIQKGNNFLVSGGEVFCQYSYQQYHKSLVVFLLSFFCFLNF
jgi:hypothetical protein